MTTLEDRKQLIRQAIEIGDLGQLIFLLDNEEKKWRSVVQQRRNEALMHALDIQDETIFRYLLSHGAEVDTDHLDSLSWDSSELLLASGWDINTIMPSGHTLLWDFIEDETFIQRLLDHGADPNVGNRADSLQSDRTRIQHPSDVIERAACFATPAILDLLIAYGARLENSNPLHTIPHLGSQGEHCTRLHAMVEHLLTPGMDINNAHQVYPDDDALTPLDSAISDGNIEMVKFLLEHGANPMTGGLSSDLARELLGPIPALVEMLEVFERSCRQNPEAMRELFGTEGLLDQPQSLANNEHDQSR